MKTASYLFVFAIVVKEKASKRQLDKNSTISGKISSLWKRLYPYLNKIAIISETAITSNKPDVDISGNGSDGRGQACLGEDLKWYWWT